MHEPKLPAGVQIKSDNDISITIKGDEKIEFFLDQDWAEQFKRQLNNYITKPRPKSSDHLKFAQALIRDLNANPNNLSPILQALLEKEKKGVRVRGWDKKESWLYKFCEVAWTSYHLSNKRIQIKTTHALLEKAYDEETRAKQRRIEDLESQLLNEQENSKSLNYAITDQNKIFTNEKEFWQRENDDIQKKLDRVNTVLKEAQGKITTAETEKKELQGLVEDLKSDKKTLEEQLQKLHAAILTNTTAHGAQIGDLQQQIKKLREENEVSGEFRKRYPFMATALAEEQLKNKDLQTSLTEANQKISKLESLYNFMKDWIDNLFGTSFGEILGRGEKPNMATKERRIKEILAENGPPEDKPATTVSTTISFFKDVVTALNPNRGPTFLPLPPNEKSGNSL